MIVAACVLALIGSSAGATTGPKPPIDDKAGTARWIVANAPYAFIATQSSSMPGWPRNNVVSSANVTLPSSGRQGVPVFYTSPFDASSKDIALNPNVSIGFSEALFGQCGELRNDSKPDPEDPMCARLTLTGRFTEASGADRNAAKAELFEQHPAMWTWPEDHHWSVAFLDIVQVWLIDVYGGATLVPPGQYWAWTPKRV